jgi:HEAT repeat protein
MTGSSTDESHEDANVWESAVWVMRASQELEVRLDNLQRRLGFEVSEQVRNVLKGSFALPAQDSAESFINLLSDDDEHVRVTAAASLPLLRVVLPDGDFVRLGPFLDKEEAARVTKLILKIIEKEYRAPVLKEVIETLKEFGPRAASRAIPVLIKLIRHRDNESQVIAISALPSFCTDQAQASAVISAFIDVIGSLNDYGVLTETCKALGCFGREAIEAVPSLKKRMTSCDSLELKHAIALALLRIDPQGFGLEEFEE